MTLAERHDFIMDLLQQQGSVSVAALAERLKVSEVTIRKDLTLLEEKKMLYRAHGSAILINPYINDRPVNEKEKHNAAEKRAIGIRAASLVTPDDSILIASGTTMLFLAREIKAQGRLTVRSSCATTTSTWCSWAAWCATPRSRPSGSMPNGCCKTSRAANSTWAWTVSTSNTGSRRPTSWRRASTAP